MRSGDLATTPLPAVLTELAEEAATGCLHIEDEAGEEALVHLKRGLVYSAHVPGRRPQLGARLISSGALAPEALEEALEAQASELQGWRLGELLVHLGYVDRSVVEAFVLEQLREACHDLSRWPAGRWRFRKNEKTREEMGTAATVASLLEEAERRAAEWEVIAGAVHGPGAVPVLSAGGVSTTELTLDQDQWALLCKVDGERTIAALARDCGFTAFEAGQIVYSLVGAGLLDVVETVDDPDGDGLAPAAAAAGIAAVLETGRFGDGTLAEEVSTLARISSALFVPLLPAEPERAVVETTPTEDLADAAEVASPEAMPVAGPGAPGPDADPIGDVAGPAEAVSTEAVPPKPVSTEPAGPVDDLVAELASITAALADLPRLGLPASLEPDFPAALDLPAALDFPAVPDVLLQPDLPSAADVVLQPEPPAAPDLPVARAGDDAVVETPAPEVDEDSLSRVSQALSALLGDALPSPEPRSRPEPVRDPAAEEAARREAERQARIRAASAAELAEAHALAEAAKRGEPGDEPPTSALAERRRRGARRRAAEDAARQEEAARQEAERLAAAEAARAEAGRLAAEAARAEAERLEAERLAVEEAARLETERLAAEEAARLEAERLAVEEAARLEAERLAAEARLEAERVAAEEAARLAEETERLAAEAAECLAAERAEAERLEAERLAAEEGERLAEAIRVEAERAETQRLAAEAAEPTVDPVVAAEAAKLVAALLDDAPDAAEAEEEVVLVHDLADPLDDVEVIEESAPPPPPAPAAVPAPGPGGLSETAALLRELSSLGLDDEPAPSPAGAASRAAGAGPTRTAPAKEAPKKRKGLFGRG